MISVLIVDDEVHSVEGLRVSTDWAGLGLGPVHTAYSMKQAQQVFAEHPVDLMLCDIEMPRGSGLDLLEWVRAQGYETENIFLTSHADFSYANQALKLGSVAYLLKPASREELEEALAGCIGRIREHRRVREDRRRARYWSDSEEDRVRQFWLGVVQGQVFPYNLPVAKAAARQNIAFSPSQRYLPVLVRLQGAPLESVGGEQGLAAAVSRVGRETEFPQAPPYLLPYGGERLVLLDTTEGEPGGHPREILKERCLRLVEHCSGRAGISLACYLGEYVEAEDLAGEVRRLLGVQDQHVTGEPGVFDPRRETLSQISYQRPPVERWMAWVGTGHWRRTAEEACAYLDSLADAKQVSGQVLARFFQDFLQELYVAAHQREIQAHLLFPEGDASARASSSLERMKAWICESMERLHQFLHSLDRSDSVVEQVRQYIRGHLAEEIGREQIAREVFLNPDYVSRLFRKQTGLSLSEFITAERIGRAKTLLRSTARPIGDICFDVGYNNGAYFSKIFKRETGVTPAQYRQGQG